MSVVPATFIIPWLFWTSTLALFEDDFVLEPVHWIILGLFLCLSSFVFYLSINISGSATGWLSPARDLAGLALVGHGVYVAWRGRDADLIEKQAFISFVVRRPGRQLNRRHYCDRNCCWKCLASTMIPTPCGCWPVSRSGPLQRFWGCRYSPSSRTVLLAALAVPHRGVDQNTIPPADQALHQKLQMAMTEGEVFRTEGLTIGLLAQQLGAPEHQLRKLINQSMGHKNFNAYLNQYRIAAAKQQLSDLEQARKTGFDDCFGVRVRVFGPV